MFYNIVASFTDAWIETVIHYLSLYLYRVASFTDAWIETIKIPLKTEEKVVASFTDAWIETDVVKSIDPTEQSHLLQMRGLKQKKKVRLPPLILSHLLQMRGLKPSPGGIAKKILVASFTDAWIETGKRV